MIKEELAASKKDFHTHRMNSNFFEYLKYQIRTAKKEDRKAGLLVKVGEWVSVFYKMENDIGGAIGAFSYPWMTELATSEEEKEMKNKDSYDDFKHHRHPKIVIDVFTKIYIATAYEIAGGFNLNNTGGFIEIIDRLDTKIPKQETIDMITIFDYDAHATQDEAVEWCEKAALRHRKV